MSEQKWEEVICFPIILVTDTKIISRLLGMTQLFGKNRVLELTCQDWGKKKTHHQRSKYKASFITS